jgi:hypothetical protein
MNLETEIYQILRKHRLSLKKREELIVDLLDFINKREKPLIIDGVVFNEAIVSNESILDEPQPLYKDYDTEVKSEVEFVCDKHPNAKTYTSITGKQCCVKCVMG